MKVKQKVSNIISTVIQSPRRLVLVLLAVLIAVSLWLARPASAAIAFRAVSIADNGSGSTSLTIAPPAGYQAGDTIVVAINVRVSANTITPPAGGSWTSVSGATLSSVDYYQQTFYKIATSTESNYVFTFSSSAKATGIAAAYSGVETLSPVDVSGSQANETASTTATAPSRTTTEANTMLVGFYGVPSSATFSAGSGMTFRTQVSSSGGGSGTSKISLALQDVAQATVGTTGVKTMTLSGSVANVGTLIALKPAPAVSVSSYRVFANATTADSKMLSVLPNPATLPTGVGTATAWSPDSTYMTVTHNNPPYLTIYKRSGDTLTKLSNPATLPTGTGQGVAWSADGVYLTVVHSTSPYVTIYKRSGDTFTKLADPASLPGSSPADTAWSPDGTYLTVTSATFPLLTIYKRSGDTFTKLADPATMPPANANATAWSPDSTYMTIAHNNSPFITIYKRSGDTFTKLADPATLPTTTGADTAWSPDGTYMTVAHDTAPYITIYKRSGDTFTKLSDPATLPAGSASATSWSADGVYLTVAHSSSPYITIYKRSGDTFTKLPDPGTLPTMNLADVAWSPNGGYVSVLYTSSANIIIYKAKPAADVSAPLAAQDTAATSGGAGAPFRLRMTLHSGGGITMPGVAFKLQYAQRSGVCDASYSGESYSDVTPTSGMVRFYNNNVLADGDGVSSDANNPTHSADSVIRQSYEESNNFSVADTVGSGQDGLWDFSLVFDSSAAYDSYCFRVVKSNGDLIDAPTQIPEVSNPAPVVGQANYRWFANADSVAPGAPLAGQDTAATIPAETPFRLRQRLAVSSGQAGVNHADYKLQYAEKSGVCDIGFSGETYIDFVPSVANETRSATVAFEDTGSGGVPWNDAGANTLLTLDGLLSGVDSTSTANTTTTHKLRLTGLGYAVPSNAVITGVRLNINNYRANHNTFYTSGLSARLMIGGVANGGLKNFNPGGSDYNLNASIGGDGDLHGLGSITASQVNDAGFGFEIGAGAEYDSYTLEAAYIAVDQFTVTVFYSDPSGDLQYYNNSGPVDLATISSNPNDPTNGARPTVYQSYRENTPFTNNIAAIPSGSDGLWDFALTSTAVADGKTYCLRVVKSDGNLLDSYSQIPEITFGVGGGGGGITTEQKLRGGRSVQNGVKSPFEL